MFAVFKGSNVEACGRSLFWLAKTVQEKVPFWLVFPYYIKCCTHTVHGMKHCLISIRNRFLWGRSEILCGRVKVLPGG